MSLFCGGNQDLTLVSGRSILEMSSDPIKTFAVGCHVGMMIGNSSDCHLKRPI